MTNPSVTVIMSTFNGERYLSTQLDSVLAQVGVNVNLVIRDDGSTDSTCSILNEYADEFNNIRIVKGENVGVGNSFMQALYLAANLTDYYAFCDQDDIWLNNKLIKAIESLNCEMPMLYCSNQTLVDRDMNILCDRYSEAIDISYLQILFNNNISGCTMVWNKPLQNILLNNRPGELLLKKRIHDVWVAMVASVVGNIYYDNNSYIFYRQHDNNVVGAYDESVFKLWLKKIKNPSLRNGRSSLAKEIMIVKDNIDDKSIIDNLVMISNCDSLIKATRLYRNKNINSYITESFAGFLVKSLFHLI